MTRETFVGLVEDTQGALRRYLCALCCGDRHLADDIAQEAFVKAWLSRDMVSDCAKFKAWVFRVAYNTFLNNRRAERPMAGYDDALGVCADEASDATFRYQELYQALDRLSPKERASVLLFYMEGYSIKEISDIAGVSADAVKQHLSRGRNHLKELLGNE